MKLFSIHCGYYDPEVGEGVYEGHINLFCVAESMEEAKRKIRSNSVFQKKKMHIDGLQEIETVDGYRISLTEEPLLAGETRVASKLHRDFSS